MKKIPQNEVAARVNALLKTFIEATALQASAQKQLERIFSRSWVNELQDIITEDRTVCTKCELDFIELDMADEGVCYGCARAMRLASISNVTATAKE